MRQGWYVLVHFIRYYLYGSIQHLINIFSRSLSATQKKKGRKQNKLKTIEDLRKEAKGGQLDIEFDKVETYKAVGKRSANFNNAIVMITKDLLEPYFFYWKDQDPDQRKLFLASCHWSVSYCRYTSASSIYRALGKKVFEGMEA